MITCLITIKEQISGEVSIQMKPDMRDASKNEQKVASYFDIILEKAMFQTAEACKESCRPAKPEELDI